MAPNTRSRNTAGVALPRQQQPPPEQQEQHEHDPRDGQFTHVTGSEQAASQQQNPQPHGDPQRGRPNLDLTGFTQHQVDLLMQMASVFPRAAQAHQELSAQTNPQDDQSEARSRPRRANSAFTRLGPSQATNHRRHGEGHHRPETWAENRKQRDLRKMIEERAAYEREMAEFEQQRQRERPSLYQRERSPIAREKESDSAQPTNADMLHTINELKKRLEGNGEQDPGESPFTKRLESQPRQKEIKHHSFNSFDGLGDPEEHLSYFDQLALHYEYNDLTRCRFFAATLRSGAQRWFCRISPRSIDTWIEFKKLFLNKFKANQQHEVHTVFLETIAQRNGETLQDYIDRFKEAVNKVVCVNETEALVHLRRGLNPYECEKYVCRLMEAKPTTLAKAYELASQAINEMESLNVLKQSRPPPTQPQPYLPRERYTTYPRTPQLNSQITHQVQSTHGPPPPPPKAQTYVPVRDRLGPQGAPRTEKRPEPEWTKFTLPRATILGEIKGKPFYAPPPPMLTAPDDRPKDKHCDYHETHGHFTENCISLKHFLERQVKAGNLSQYLPRQVQATATTQGQGKNIVNTVFGGQTSPQREDSQIYSISRGPASVITFTDADYEGIDPNHTEALVVSLDVAANEVKRILVDNGSSVDICSMEP